MSLFAGKVILITGGTSGIGRATAIAFAEEGASVVVSGRREKEGEESLQLIPAMGDLTGWRGPASVRDKKLGFDKCR